MPGRFVPNLAALLWFASAAFPVGAQSRGIPIAPHGFPAFYSDGTLALEPCLPLSMSGFEVDPVTGQQTVFPSGRSTRPDLCLFDPIDPASPASVQLGVGGESFWYSADASMAMPGGGQALLVMGMEGAFGGAGSPADGQQIAFGRIRIRVDTPTIGTYTVTYPYGVQTFNVATAGKRAINVTFDIGAINPLDPVAGFDGALASEPIMKFLTWPDYANDPTLQVRDPNNQILEQYIGNPNIPHIVTDGLNGPAVFRVQGPAGSGVDVQTNLFTVMGKVHAGPANELPHLFPAPPVPNLFAVGPVNRRVTVDFPAPPVLLAPDGSVLADPLRPDGLVTGPQGTVTYPVGYPVYFQDTVVTSDTSQPPITTRSGGLKLTYCPPSDPMCISAPIDPLDPHSVALSVGEESFFWSADASIDGDLPANQGVDGRLVMSMEGAFGGAGTPLDKQQIGFARVRIRVDGLPEAGEYVVTYPYGEETFDVVADTKGDFGIDTTVDVMNADAMHPDQSFAGALFGAIGPQFLTWTTFDIDPATPASNDPRLQKFAVPGDPASPIITYIGDPNLEHPVKGSPLGTNFFRVQGQGIDVRTDLFAVSGKVYDPLTFAIDPVPPVETIAFTARFSVRKSRLELRGTSTFPGTILTVYPGTAVSGPSLGTLAVAADGTWSFRATTRTNLTSVTLVSNSPGATTVTQPLQLR